MLVLAGAGEPSVLYYLQKMKNGSRVDLVIDNDPMVQGKQFFDHKIQSPQMLTHMTEKNRIKVIITSVRGYDKFEAQVLSAGIPKENIKKLKPSSEKLIPNLEIGIKKISDIFLLLNKNGIKCLPAYGTLLGLIRENNLLPYDNDVDTWIMDENLNRLHEDILNTIQKKFFPKAQYMRIRKYCLPENKFCEFRKPVTITVTFYFADKTLFRIDFFLLCKSGAYYYNTDSQVELFRLPTYLFDTIKYFKVSGRNLLVPSRSDEILTTIYGDWRVPKKPNEDDGKYRGHLHEITNFY